MRRKTVLHIIMIILAGYSIVLGILLYGGPFKKVSIPSYDVATQTPLPISAPVVDEEVQYLLQLEKDVLAINAEIRALYETENGKAPRSKLSVENERACWMCEPREGYQSLGDDLRSTICLKSDDEKMHEGLDVILSQIPLMAHLGYEYNVKYPFCLHVEYTEYEEKGQAGETGEYERYPHYYFLITERYRDVEIERIIDILAHELSHIGDLQRSQRPTSFDTCIQKEAGAHVAESFVLITLDPQSVHNMFERLRVNEIYESKIIMIFENIRTAWEECDDLLKSKCLPEYLHDLYNETLPEDDFFGRSCMRYETSVGNVE